MIEQDTIRLLRECDAGVKMGTKSIKDVLEYVSDAEFKELLDKCKKMMYYIVNIEIKGEIL